MVNTRQNRFKFQTKCYELAFHSLAHILGECEQRITDLGAIIQFYNCYFTAKNLILYAVVIITVLP